MSNTVWLIAGLFVLINEGARLPVPTSLLLFAAGIASTIIGLLLVALWIGDREVRRIARGRGG